uniref:Uncharacterized protein n=1 Tax=Physcomitrium patens TaxID=3218 RepID=A0A2K1J957_PHYPA|nr:hypothetical protein PHYPA_021158 [Physcomitrium patens]
MPGHFTSRSARKHIQIEKQCREQQAVLYSPCVQPKTRMLVQMAS